MVSRTATKTLVVVLTLATSSLLIVPALAEEAVFVGQAAPAVKITIHAVNHHQWSELLARYVDRDGSVAYTRWHACREDRTRLADYLDTLSSVDADASSRQNEKLAFWINAYNALTISGVLHHYPVDSIREVAGDEGGFNIWDDYRIYVGGRLYSLNQIEHDVLRKMRDPRIHFAINCASKSCPALSREAYTSARVDRQLTTSATDFFANPHNLSRDAGAIRVSSLLDWYSKDFGETDSEVLARIQPWMPEKMRASASDVESVLRYRDYDWSLNATNETPDHH